MSVIHRFIKENVEPADRMAEVVFGLVMALGVTGALRLGVDDLGNRELFVSVVGCNLAWAIVDAVVLVLMRLFERGRLARIARMVRASENPDAAIAIVESEIPPQVLALMTAEERSRIREISLAVLERAGPVSTRLRTSDVLHGIAVAMLVFLPTVPVVIPYVAIEDTLVAVRVSSAIAIVLLFVTGLRWGQLVGGRGWRIGTALTVLGVTLVGVTIMLGG